MATVRKDVWDLKENFPLHITIGPKVAKSLELGTCVLAINLFCDILVLVLVLL